MNLTEGETRGQVKEFRDSKAPIFPPSGPKEETKIVGKKFYRIVSCASTEELEDEVNKLIDEGYLPLGAPLQDLSNSDEEADVFTQALINRDLKKW